MGQRTLVGSHINSARSTSMKSISRLLEEAVKAGTVPENTDPGQVAEYLETGACGIMFFWMNLTQEESAVDVARRIMPTVFSAVAGTVPGPDWEPECSYFTQA